MLASDASDNLVFRAGDDISIFSLSLLLFRKSPERPVLSAFALFLFDALVETEKL